MRGHIRQRSKGSWEIAVDIGKEPTGGKRRQHFETVRGTKGAAQKRLAEVMVEIGEGGYVKTQRNLTVGDYLNGWLQDYVDVNCSPRTRESYAMIARCYIIPELGAMRLRELEPRHLQTFYSRKKESGLGSRTVRYCYSLLAEALGHAMKMGLVARNVAKATEPPRVESRVMPTLSPDDVTKFFETAKETCYYPLFYLMLHTGLRRGEALALQWKHIDMGLATMGISSYLSVTQSLYKLNGRATVKEPKSAAGRRRIALPPSLALVLHQHKAQQEAQQALLDRHLSDEDYVFAHPDGTPFDPSTISHAFNKLIRRAGLPAVRLHDLRHTHATLLLQAGIHPKVVQERLGHSSIRVTLDTYSHVIGGLQEAAAQKFDDFLAAKGKSASNVGKMLANAGEPGANN